MPDNGSALACPRRLDAASALELTGHQGDPHLDAAVATVALACGVPMAVVNVASPGLQTYPAEVGVGSACTHVSDELSFCVEVVESGRPMTVADAPSHPRYRANPMVQAGAIGAYAGHPIVHDGQVVAVLSMFDDRPRTFFPSDLEILRHQACLVAGILAMRGAAAWDSLTGLARRPLLLDRVERALTRARLSGRVVGLVTLDVTGMRALNLQHGSTAGDAVLTAVGQRLSAALGPNDSVARIGGDEFGLVLGDLGSVDEVQTRVAKVLEVVTGPVEVGEQVHDIEVRAGLSTTPADSAEALLAAAERALRTDPARPSDSQAAVVAELRRGIEADEFLLHYQPVVNLRTGEVTGVEALVRWQHPDRGLLPPAAFIADAEASGLIVPLGQTILRRAAEQIASWCAGGRELTVAVNLSAVQLAQPGFRRQVEAVLAASGAPAQLLVLEITESSVLDEPAAPAVLAELRGLGIGLALDDFGTGYSSMSYLRRFPVDTIKVDQSFVAGLGVSPDDDAIVASIVRLATAVNKQIIAEGVESPAQATALRMLEVELAQGFLWSPAVPVAELEAFLARPPSERLRPAMPAGDDDEMPDATAEARIRELHEAGASLHSIAAALNADGRRTPGGVRWHTRSVGVVVASWQLGRVGVDAGERRA